jgi:hypothetical protein
MVWHECLSNFFFLFMVPTEVLDTPLASTKSKHPLHPNLTILLYFCYFFLHQP